MQQTCRHLPQGALRQPDESVVWRVWAPLSRAVSLVAFSGDRRREIAMAAEGGGYFTCRQAEVAEGLRYALKLFDGREYPDPASRWQPDGVHRPSAVFSPRYFRWSDAGWRGVARDELAIYELHVGTFTPEGTFAAITARLPQLLSLGVTAVELMPVAQFAGERNWGYDAVYPYAVQNSYGGPQALQRFINAAHEAGLAVILDVVYNHFGPEGNYSGNYGPYCTDRYRTPWGMAINYDGPESDAVRQFVIDNALMWVRDFHADGLRIDAVQAIYDFSPRHILAEIQAAVQQEAARAGRLVHVIAESDQNDVRLIRPPARGGFGLDGVWSDDFHHSVHALLSGERGGYYEDFGEPAHLAKALNGVFVYDGCYSRFHRRRHGTCAGAADRSRFVVCMQNHDQVGNRARGDRLAAILSPGAQRLACGLLLLSPCVPLLFMGEEYGETRPFPFFCSFSDPVVIEGVRRGRRGEFAALALPPDRPLPDPQDPGSFMSAALQWAWPEGSPQAGLRRLYQDLLAARRRWPALRDRRRTAARLVRVPDPANRGGQPALLLLQRGGDGGLRAVANLGQQSVPRASVKRAAGEVLLSTEDARYGGSRPQDRGWGEILAHELLVFDGGGRQ